MDELAHLLYTTKKLISKVDTSEPSFIKPKYSLNDIETAIGSSFIEASRGSLSHKVEVSKGLIKTYDVITPTVWNLGPGIKDKYGVAQKAIVGLDSISKAEIVLRSFDICSVCTTH